MSRTFSREDLNDEVLNPRLQREKAHIGTITASLIWQGHTDLDLHAHVNLSTGGKEHIFFRNKKGTGGELDVDANASQVVDDPVENIYWDKPPAGAYRIEVNNFSRQTVFTDFRVRLMLPNETLDYEGKLKGKTTTQCFKFSVDEEGGIKVGALAAPRIMRKPSKNYLLAGRRAGAKAKSKAKARPMKATRKAMKKAMKKVMKKAMKKKKPMKSMKVAKGKNSKAKVFSGRFEKTSSGLTKADFVLNKENKVVSKKRSAIGKRRYSNVKPWVEACKKARSELGLTGFVALRKGSDLYKKAREIFDASK